MTGPYAAPHSGCRTQTAADEVRIHSLTKARAQPRETKPSQHAGFLSPPRQSPTPLCGCKFRKFVILCSTLSDTSSRHRVWISHNADFCLVTSRHYARTTLSVWRDFRCRRHQLTPLRTSRTPVMCGQGSIVAELEG